MQVFGDDGARVDVRVEGSGGVPIVLIHGFPLTREIWNSQAQSLAQRHRAILPDVRGVGASSVPEGPYLMETLASDVAAALDALGIERAAIAGHSMGGYVALAFARMFTERVTHLALICGRLAADSPQQAQARFDLADRIESENDSAAVIDAYLPRLFAPETIAQRPQMIDGARAIASANDPRGLAALLRGMAMRVPADDIAPELDVPVAVIAGARDAVVSLDEAREVAGKFGRARLTVCEGSGHLAMLEEPDAVAAALEQLLSE